MNNKGKKLLNSLLLFQFLWASVYLPVANAQVPPINSEAGDWSVYQKVNEDDETFTNLLLILDTSDSMNQPESWRPYAGSYNSHIEYLWNDPAYINNISVEEPVAPTGLTSASNSELVQVRKGYWSYVLKEDDNTLLDLTLRKKQREILRKEAIDQVNTTIKLTFDGNTEIKDLPKSIYRNYGGPVNESVNGMNSNMWFNSSWIYWVKTGTVNSANLHKSPYLYSTSFSRYRGANSSIGGTRATINYLGDLHPSAINNLNSTGINGNLADYERLNICEVSRYDDSANAKKLTGVGVIGSGIKPSTTYAPAWSRESVVDTTSGLTTNKAVTPITLFNLGYSKNLEMVRFDPYANATQTRASWVEGYPGPGLVDNFDTVWPPVSTSLLDKNYFFRVKNNLFQPGYLDLRCWVDANSLDVSKTMSSNPACNYAIIGEPMRDNYVAYSTTSGHYSTNPYNKNQAFGTIGQPIRVLRQKLRTTDTNKPPKDRTYNLTYGGCANSDTSVNEKNYTNSLIGPGAYTDYLCSNIDNDLWMGWTRLRSDSGGYIHARAIYQLAKQVNITSAPAGVTHNDFRVDIVKNMLSVYKVKPFNEVSSRWGKDNDNKSIKGREIDKVLFAGWLGTRDCFDLTNSVLSHCASKPNDVEYATGTPAYWDHTRSTYNYWERPDDDGTLTDKNDKQCYDLNGNIIDCNKFLDVMGNVYDTAIFSNGVYTVNNGNVEVFKASKPYIRSGTFKVVDPNSGKTLTNDKGDDISDTLGDIRPNNLDNMASGAREIVINVSSNYRRKGDCTANKNSIEYAATEAAQSGGMKKFIFTNHACQLATSYSSTNDCQKKDSSGNWNSANQSECNNLNISAPVCSQPGNDVKTIRKYSTTSCGFFSYTGSFEGTPNVKSYGNSCSAVDGNDVYLIDWQNKSKDTTSLAVQYNNWLGSGGVSSKIGVPNGITNSNNINYKQIGDLQTSSWCDVQGGTRISATKPDNTSELCTMTASQNRVSSLKFGSMFSPVFYTEINTGAVTKYEYINTGINNSASCKINDSTVNTIDVACSSAVNSAKGFVGVEAASESAAKNVITTNASCSTDYRYPGDGITRDSSEYGGVKGTLPFYVFEAYNVDKFGTHEINNDAENRGSIFKDSKRGRYMPALFHACRQSNPKVGEGNVSKWDDVNTAEIDKEKFDNFYKFAEQAKEYLNPNKTVTPVANLSTVFSTNAPNLSNKPTSKVDLYSVNYLNYRFGPKYQGAPIGRRTRIQVAQDVLAEVIASADDTIRIGLMSFGYLDSQGTTKGGYVVNKVATLDKVACFEQALIGTVNGSTVTLNSVSMPENWIEMVADEVGNLSIPIDFVKSTIRHGGLVFIAGGVKFDSVPISGISSNGEITLSSTAPVPNGSHSIILQNCALPNYADLLPTGHRKKLITGLFSLKAVAQTPITETLYEAYLYYAGETPSSGGVGVADNTALLNNGEYKSPMKTLVDELNDPDACMNNLILLVTDGYSYGDAKDNAAIANLSAQGVSSGNVAVNLMNDTSGGFQTSEINDTMVQNGNGLTSVSQFKDTSASVDQPYGYVDAYYTDNNYSLFDELAYFIGNADITPTGVNSVNSVSLAAITLDVDCSPAIENGLLRNNGSKCNNVRNAEEFLDVVHDLLNSVNAWVPSAVAAAIPLPASNRSSSSTDVYMGMFEPSNTQIWTGNMKKYQLAFSPKDCGFDVSFNPIDICMTSRNVLKTYYVGNTKVELRNIISRSNSENDLNIVSEAVDYFSKGDIANPAKEGKDVIAGGVNSHLVEDGYPKPSNTKVYTFISSSLQNSQAFTPNVNLSESQNNVNEGNRDLVKYDKFSYPSSLSNINQADKETQAKEAVRYMLGAANPADANPNIRETLHGDVMHSLPASVTYMNGQTMINRIYYLTANGDLISVTDVDDVNNSSAGNVNWRFYPEESLQKQIEMKMAYGRSGADQKIFGADGGVSTIVFDKNKDGFVNIGDDHVYIAFGLRRGGRAVYVIDVTNPDKPKLQWKMSNESFCSYGTSSSFTCVTQSEMGSIYPGIPVNFLSELGYTWSTPVLGFVNKPVKYIGNPDLQSVVEIKDRQPVAIFGGGYDPEEDKTIRDPSNLEMGRALYVVDALNGIPIKMWSNSSNLSSDTNAVGKFIKYTSSTLCRDVLAGSTLMEYPISSVPFTYNVDFDAQNTFDRIYVGDLGGQVFRFDIGAVDKKDWEATLMADFSHKISRSDYDYSESSNIVNGVKKRSRKIMQAPIRAGWTRGEESYDYIYVATGDIEHPWTKTTQDLTAVFLDAETGVRMRCAPRDIIKTTNLYGDQNKSIYNLVDITNVGRVDRNTDGVIDKNDIFDSTVASTDSVYGSGGTRLTRENIEKAPFSNADERNSYDGLSLIRTDTNGAMGWFYRMERGEKAVSQPRVINGVLSWTAFAPLFGSNPCSLGTGTKYYLDAYWGTTVDTNLDGKVTNCLATLLEKEANKKSNLVASGDAVFGSPGSGSATAISIVENKQSDAAENILRTPEFLDDGSNGIPGTGGSGGGTGGGTGNLKTTYAGLKSIHCDSPRPVYNTSYGLLPADSQVVHDGKIYRVGLVPQGNSRGGVYDENLDFFGTDDDGTGLLTNTNTGMTSLSSTPEIYEEDTNGDGVIGVGDQKANASAYTNSSAAGNYISKTRRPGQLYWFRDDLR